MFCPKCGSENPDTGRFCRSCGTDLGNVNNALAEIGRPSNPLCDRRGRPLTIEGAVSKLFLGGAFLVIAIILGATGNASGWWFWLLIPAFTIIGAGVAQMISIKRNSRSNMISQPQVSTPLMSARAGSLPPPKTSFVEPESRYKTGDLVPTSVTENTTRHLEADPENETMTLPANPVK